MLSRSTGRKVLKQKCHIVLKAVELRSLMEALDSAVVLLPQEDIGAFKDYSLEDAKGGRAVPDPQQPKLEKKPKTDEPKQAQGKPQDNSQGQEQKPASSPPKQPSGAQHNIEAHLAISSNVLCPVETLSQQNCPKFADVVQASQSKAVW